MFYLLSDVIYLDGFKDFGVLYVFSFFFLVGGEWGLAATGEFPPVSE